MNLTFKKIYKNEIKKLYSHNAACLLTNISLSQTVLGGGVKEDNLA